LHFPEATLHFPEATLHFIACSVAAKLCYSPETDAKQQV